MVEVSAERSDVSLHSLSTSGASGIIGPVHEAGAKAGRHTDTYSVGL